MFQKYGRGKLLSAPLLLAIGVLTLTSKHHDGFAMFATKQSDWNIVDRTPYKKAVLNGTNRTPTGAWRRHTNAFTTCNPRRSSAPITTTRPSPARISRCLRKICRDRTARDSIKRR